MTENRNYTLERDQEVIPVVRKLLLALADRADLVMGSAETTSKEKAAEYYQGIYKEIVIPILMESNLKLCDITYVFQMMQQPIQLLKDVTISSFEMNQDLADAKKYGVKDIDDLRVMDLDRALKEE